MSAESPVQNWKGIENTVEQRKASVGVYYFNSEQQVVGYWRSQKRDNKSYFVPVCYIMINEPLQNVLVEAVRNSIK